MKITDLNNNLINKKVSIVVTATRVNGTILQIENDEHTKGIVVEHEPVNWGKHTFTTTRIWGRKSDGWGSIIHAKLLLK